MNAAKRETLPGNLERVPMTATCRTALTAIHQEFAKSRGEFLMQAARDQGLDPGEWSPDFTAMEFIREKKPTPARAKTEPQVFLTKDESTESNGDDVLG